MDSEDKVCYGYWRKDKEASPGETHEFISSDSQFISDRCSLDELDALPFEGIDTLTKALKRNLDRIPDQDYLGWRNGDHYEWLTYKQTCEYSENLGQGELALGLVPEIEAEGKKWRFIGC